MSSILYETYAKSPEKGLSAEKIPTKAYLYLKDKETEEVIEDTTQFVGNEIFIAALLHRWYEPAAGFMCVYKDAYRIEQVTEGKVVGIYHRLNGGAWAKIGSVTIDRGCGGRLDYVLTEAGRHDFYAKFEGTAYLAGCEKAAKTFARAR